MWRTRFLILASWLLGSLVLGWLHVRYYFAAPDWLGVKSFTAPAASISAIMMRQSLRYALWAPLLPLFAAFVRRHPLGSDLFARWQPLAWIAASVPVWLGVHAALVATVLWFGGIGTGQASLFDEWRIALMGPVVQHAAVAVVILLTLASRDAQQRMRAQDRAVEALRTAAAAAQVKALQSPAQPRLFFATLASLTSLIPVEPTRAMRLVGRLGEFLRSSLQRANRPEVELREELEFVRQLLAVEEMRAGGALEQHWAVAPEVRDCLVPTQLLPQLVEQALLARDARGLRIGAELAAGDKLVLRILCDGAFEPGLERTRALLTARYGASGHSLATVREASFGGVELCFPATRAADESTSDPLSPALALHPA